MKALGTTVPPRTPTERLSSISRTSRRPSSTGRSPLLNARANAPSTRRSRRRSNPRIPIVGRLSATLVRAAATGGGALESSAPLGRVAELADALASGASVRKDVGVQVPPRPPPHPGPSPRDMGHDGGVQARTSALSGNVRDAVEASHLSDLPVEVLDELLEGAVHSTLPAGKVAHHALEPGEYLELVVAGVIRVFVTAPDGRTMTIRYCRRGELLGAMSLFTDGFAEPATKQALVDTQLLRMSPTKVRELAHRDLRVARALLVELSERAHGFVNEIPGTAFATVRQRVARQLLDLAAVHCDGSRPNERACGSDHPTGPGRLRRYGPRGRGPHAAPAARHRRGAHGAGPDRPPRPRAADRSGQVEHKSLTGRR